MADQSSMTLLWKAIRLEAPRSMSDRFQLDGNNFLETVEPRIIHTMNSWRLRATSLWNRLPDDLRGMMSLPIFKKRTKQWLVDHRELRQFEPD